LRAAAEDLLLRGGLPKHIVELEFMHCFIGGQANATRLGVQTQTRQLLLGAITWPKPDPYLDSWHNY
jgi:hypothetical protein